MKARIVSVEHRSGEKWTQLMFVCPGCLEFGGSGLHSLTVNSGIKRPTWQWNGSLEKPTLSPSIMTGRGTDQQCHGFLKEGKFEFLTDSKHSLAGKKDVGMPELPDWIIQEAENGP